MRNLTVYAPAKINLDLKITGKRSDGFHEIRSLMIPIPLTDELTFCESSLFEFEQDEKLDFPPEKNLVYKVADKFLSTFGISDGVKITLKKNIPDGAGLGGGSSDAASTLLGLQKFFDLQCDPKKIFALAAEAGSDVPFFLLKSPAIVSGRGEILEASEFPVHGNLLVVMPDFSINTATAYADYDRLQGINDSPKCDYPALLKTIARDEQLMKQSFGNSFVFAGMQHESEIRRIISALYAEGAFFASMSGSGASCFGFFSRRPDVASFEKNFCSYRIFDLKI